MSAIIGYFRAQIAEIERDDALRWYGVAMAFLHVVTYLFWVDQRIASFASLFVPGKRDGLRVLVTLFYFWAGSLKLNWEWISGAGLYRPIWPFSGVGVVAACVYVIVLELGVAWGLLAKRAWIFWAAFAQFFLFHALSWQVVGFFYPLLMFAILTIFPLIPLLAPREPPDGLLVSLWRGRARRSVYAIAALFSMLQLVPSPTRRRPSRRSRGAARAKPRRAGRTRTS